MSWLGCSDWGFLPRFDEFSLILSRKEWISFGDGVLTCKLLADHQEIEVKFGGEVCLCSVWGVGCCLNFEVEELHVSFGAPSPSKDCHLHHAMTQHQQADRRHNSVCCGRFPRTSFLLPLMKTKNLSKLGTSHCWGDFISPIRSTDGGQR